MEEIIDKMMEKWDDKMFILKALEEMAELSEVLLKCLTKSEKYKPPREKIVEELGDVIFRAKALSRKLGLDREVGERIDQKIKQVNLVLQEK